MSNNVFVRSRQDTHTVSVTRPEDCINVHDGRDAHHMDRHSVVRLMADGMIVIHVMQQNGLQQEHAEMTHQEFNQRLMMLVRQHNEDETIRAWTAEHLTPKDEPSAKTV